MVKVFTVGNIQDVPEYRGVYAWYFTPQLSTYDIKNLIKKIDSDKSNSEAVIKDFLEKFIFSPLGETPYMVSIKGQLKPMYKGEIGYINNISPGLISRLAAKPELLFEIKEIFSLMTHDFLSPIYIGMAKNLKVRLNNHVKLMKQLREAEASFQSGSFSALEGYHLEETEIDHKFAHEVVVQRKLDINDLQVHVFPIEFSDKIQVDIENILNRINFPLCGRN